MRGLYSSLQPRFCRHIHTFVSPKMVRREVVYAVCMLCHWRQRARMMQGFIAFREYYCMRCGGPLIIISEVIDDDEGHNPADTDDKNDKDDKSKKDKKDKHDKNGKNGKSKHTGLNAKSKCAKKLR